MSTATREVVEAMTRAADALDVKEQLEAALANLGDDPFVVGETLETLDVTGRPCSLGKCAVANYANGVLAKIAPNHVAYVTGPELDVFGPEDGATDPEDVRQRELKFSLTLSDAVSTFTQLFDNGAFPELES